MHRAIALCMLGAGLHAAAPAQEPAAELQSLREQVSAQQGLIEQQQKQLDAQRKMLERLQQSIDQQARLLERVSGAPAASRQPEPAAALVEPVRAEKQTTAAAAPPLQLQVGNATIMPVGFMDATAVWRDKNAGSSIGSNFGSVPYGNAAAGRLTEFRFSPQNSRLGFRVDGDWKGTHFIGYNEFDFLGTGASNTIGITNGAFVPRLRLFWADVRRGKFEFLGGQSWSLLTPNRRGLSALPSDLFYSQVIDVNYMAGLTWTRQAGFRFLYHPSQTVALGLSLENPNQYIGGSAGGPQITLPAGLTALAGAQLDNGSTGFLGTPNLHPDVIAKVAFDPSARLHLELAGIARSFRVFNPAAGTTNTVSGAGGAINANFALVKSFRLVTNNYWSDGGGRYLFGQAPDVIVRADGTLSPVHSGGTVNGFEATAGNFLFYGYYGGIYVRRNVAVDTNGTLVGYGFQGSPGSQNRAIHEVTFGFNQTVWKDSKYGAINFMGQWEYLLRNPWHVAAGAPKSAHDNTVYVNLRYTLPGAPPSVER